MGYTKDSNLASLANSYWFNLLKLSTDNIPEKTYKFISTLRTYYFNFQWYEVYDFIEETLNNYPSQFADKSDIFSKKLNQLLVKENSAYRIINKQIIEITSEQEIQSIEETLENTNPYSGVQQHLNQALKLMSDRQNPNYAKSMQESISAVEGLAMRLLNHNSITLRKAIPQLKNKYGLHQNLLASLDKLYAYTCDEDGVRHGSPNKSSVTYSEAKFTLIACTNFINYLIDKTKDQN